MKMKSALAAGVLKRCYGAAGIRGGQSENYRIVNLSYLTAAQSALGIRWRLRETRSS
jgi:hypothetical protein